MALISASQPGRRRGSRRSRADACRGPSDGGGPAPPSEHSRRQRLDGCRESMRRSPWIDVHRANRESGGELERFVFQRLARFPEARPAAGDVALWVEGHAGPNPGLDGMSRSSDALRSGAGRPGAPPRRRLDRGRRAAIRRRGHGDLAAAGRLLVRDGPGGARRLHDAPGRSRSRLERGRRGAAVLRAFAGAQAARGAGTQRRPLERRVPGRRQPRPDCLGARRHDRLGLLRRHVAGGPGHDSRGSRDRLPAVTLDAPARRASPLGPAPSRGLRGDRHRLAPRLGAGLAAGARRRGHRARAVRRGRRAATRRTSSAVSPPRSTRWASAFPDGWRRSAGCTSSLDRRTA